ncbi:hypothetical protein JWG39_07040 [Desulforhopalus vacuolatus]|uniref:hypothetical protein n=1 Tax=Desulforhopalus vacuolatus TaxID=40414 RepID=UPI0019624FCA|nr:hypothetical protein [Desulforhopalus vacuolatus]MBM9519574.1 hypothetical protein [Desulforhopalus vacuolatus]
MGSDEVQFIPCEEAMAMVSAIQEEEDVEQPDHRILTVYGENEKELCWFDFDEVMNDIGNVPEEDKKEAVNRYILERIPSWVKTL